VISFTLLSGVNPPQKVGMAEGTNEMDGMREIVGVIEGCVDGFSDGCCEGLLVGNIDGWTDGFEEGT